ncbi:uncharacterized protein ARMOST_10634 [Armillaria ostoyae]|uniref:Uncharacterized protein n=1 Tax=Armillaria ostoyae TaxID=47428 RepID=A0A284RET9_ARMOS|nr:uncharacterized protein ARMOST_10634 [Armillaria ostoyae]
MRVLVHGTRWAWHSGPPAEEAERALKELGCQLSDNIDFHQRLQRRMQAQKSEALLRTELETRRPMKLATPAHIPNFGGLHESASADSHSVFAEIFCGRSAPPTSGCRTNELYFALTRANLC